MNNPLVSIIIPTYNRADLIGETLDSVLAQTYTNWECIIVDDGSTDNSEFVISKYVELDSRFKFYNRPVERPKGANACRNHGFEMSEGEYVMFLDSDDFFESFCLSERISIMLDKQIDLLIRDIGIFKNLIRQNKSFNKDPEDLCVESYLRMFLRYEIPWPIMGALYKRAILSNCSFDEMLERFQDVSFNIKVLTRNNNLKIFRDYRIDSYYRIDGTKKHLKEFVDKVLRSLVTFNEIHKDLLNLVEYRFDLRKFNSKIVSQFMIPNSCQHKKESNRVILNLLKLKIFKFDHKIILLLYLIFLNANLLDKKGIGMHRFHHLYKKVICN
ncbi:UDP-Glc:alpha-D-GlcNAc-diphosphoundecaprenol beta-1,3-glucosyltransferase WfgD [compost metagenome]